MHILLTGLYGFTIAFASILYALIAHPDNALAVALCAPLIASGAVLVLLGIDFALRTFTNRGPA